MAYSPAENLYLSALTELQFPSALEQDMAQAQTDAAETEAMEPVVLAAGPSQTVTDAGAGRGSYKGYDAQADAASKAPMGEIKPIDPTARQQLAEFLQAGFERFGMDRYKARRQAQTIMGGESSNLPLTLGLADIVPYLGTAMQTQEAFRMGEDAAQSVKRGEYGTAALQAGGAAVGMIPGVGGTMKAAKPLVPKAGEMLGNYMRRAGLELNIVAHHGTPHAFDKFDASKIGTGEGAQAYGYGLYFAESKDVAKGYQMATSKSRFLTKDGLFDPSDLEHLNVKAITRRGDLDQAIEAARKYAQPDSDYPETAAKAARDLSRLEALKSSGGIKPNEGRLITVDIPDAMVGKMLDFDAPIADQSQEIQALAKQYKLSPSDLGGDLLAAADGKTPAGAQKLREAGIPGVRYLDQGSRNNAPKVRTVSVDGKTQYEVNPGWNAPNKLKFFDTKEEAQAYADSFVSRNIVVFPGGENKIKIIKTEGAK